jgi:hypothetical protein
VAIVGNVTTQRVLIHIPIIHTPADMGALGEDIKRQLVQRFGERWWQSKVSAVDRFWEDIEAALLGGALPYERIRIYQDGLPVCGRELDIVKELEAAGSRNHRLILEMVRRGATVMGTESGELLIEEYGRIRSLLGKTEAPAAQGDVKASGAALIEKRDRFIAARIGATLARGEVGILFLGMMHSISGFLSADVRLIGFVPFANNRSRLMQVARLAKSLR